MLTSGQQERKSKQRKIRNSEYYDMEGTFDRLYAESKKDKTLILSILVDTFISKISFPMQPGPEIGSISDA